MKYIFMPIRFILWLGTVIIFWPVLALALMIFNPDVVSLSGWLRSQQRAFREFVLLEEL
jgi:hypothetical protein